MPLKKNHYILLSLIIVWLLGACSPQKNTFVSRNFQTMTTKYNVLFNGEEAFKSGLTALEKKHEDNFWKPLAIEPITFTEPEIPAPIFGFSGGPGSTKAPSSLENTPAKNPFDIAEEKAVKAIQKRSMQFNGTEKNRQIDDAYLLLGKARYYTQRFVPAIEAFNYVIAHYPQANLIHETKIWRAKANIRIDNEELAIESLRFLLDVDAYETPLTDNVKEQAHTAMAMAYAKTDSIQEVIKHLTAAVVTRKNKVQAARNMFVLGQIYSQLQHKDSASMVFQKLIDFKKAPYKYRIHAHIALAKNTDKNSDTTQVHARLQKLIRNRDNRPYLDALQYQVGMLYVGQKKHEKALTAFQQSLAVKDGGAYQKTHTHERLGDVYFNQANFVLASAHYDSVLQLATDEVKRERRIRRVQRKHKALIALNTYEAIVKLQDSVLRIAVLPLDAQQAYFEKHIQLLKKKDEALAQQQRNALAFGTSSGGGVAIGNKTKGAWYFYNTQSVGFGKQKFEETWGNRALEDNWRFSDKTSTVANITETNTVTTVPKRYDIAVYLAGIPTRKKTIDSLAVLRNDALFQLGVIYKEQFKNVPLAIDNFTRLDSLNSSKKVAVAIAYHLYQIYSVSGGVEKAAALKEEILEKYPNTRYAQLLQLSPEETLASLPVDAVATYYKEMYYLYKANEFEEVVQAITAFTPTISMSDLLPKFELLKALSLGRYASKEVYKTALQFVAFEYSNTPQGEKARAIIKQLTRKK